MRSVFVWNVEIETILLSSIFHVGDAAHIAPDTKAYAVQREVPIYSGNEGDLSQYPVFEQPFPRVQFHERVDMGVRNCRDSIRVRNVRIIGVSTSSVVQLGNSVTIDTAARVKHIRHLLPRPDND